MNEELLNKAKKMIDSKSLESGDEEMLGLLLVQYAKYPESRRIEGSIREMIKRTRTSVQLSEAQRLEAELAGEDLYKILYQYPTLAVPTRKNRTLENCVKAFTTVLKEDVKSSGEE